MGGYWGDRETYEAGEEEEDAIAAQQSGKEMKQTVKTCSTRKVLKNGEANREEDGSCVC